ncbi:MAG: YqjF family protein [Terriglobales bacterium]
MNDPKIAQILATTEHRPWPLPHRPWVQVQAWNHLLFAHWAVDSDYLRPMLPRELPLDIYDGRAWVGVTPFVVTGLGPRGLPPIPGVSRFCELNVRTYTSGLDGKPGVYFFSLDCESLLAVIGARIGHGLPYLYARMFADVVEGEVRFYCRRMDVDRARPEFHGNVSPDLELLRTRAEFRGRYRPAGPVRLRAPGTVEHFLTERYCLYTVQRGRVYRAQIHHVQWPLQDASADVEANTMALADGIRLPDSPPLLHYAKRLKVMVWAEERIA